MLPRFFLRFLLAFSLLLQRGNSPLYAQAGPARALTIDRANNRLQQDEIKLPSGATFTLENGSEVAIEGVLSGIPEAGSTFDFTNVTFGAPLFLAQGGTGATSAADARTNLGLVIGTHVQAYDADLGIWATITPSANVQTLLSAADYAAFRAALGLVIGTHVQAYDADLDDLADGSLTGSKVGSGISATNITSGTLAAARNGTLLAVRTTNATARTSTTTFTDDDVLVINAVPTGNYRVSGFVQFENESVTPGGKIRLAFSGTLTPRGGTTRGGAHGGSINFVRNAPELYGDTGIFSFYTGFDGVLNYGFWFDYVVNISVTGNLTLQWAQTVSSADDSILTAGSFVILEPLP